MAKYVCVSLSKYVCKVYHLKKTKDVYIQNTGNGCGRRARNAVLDRERHANAGAEKLN